MWSSLVYGNGRLLVAVPRQRLGPPLHFSSLGANAPANCLWHVPRPMKTIIAALGLMLAAPAFAQTATDGDTIKLNGCGFRRSGPPIPNEGGHRFRLMAARDSDDPGHCSPLLAL